jgi:hypothetical protein
MTEPTPEPVDADNDDCYTLPDYVFHLAVHKNNKGVDVYKSGDCKSSIQTLSHALECMQHFSKHHQKQQQLQQQLQQQQQRERTTSSNGASTTPATTIVCAASSTNDSSNRIPLNRAEESLETETYEAGFGSMDRTSIHVDPKNMYSCALYLACSGDCGEALANPSLSCSESDLGRITGSILFNLALVHHTYAGEIATNKINIGSFGAVQQEQERNQQGQQQLGAVATMLEKAIVLYKLSLTIQEQTAPISPLHIMALCNNIGQCHSSLLQHSEARWWNERLLRLMVCHYDASSSHNPKSNCNCECFFQNTLSLILRDPRCSPAA